MNTLVELKSQLEQNTELVEQAEKLSRLITEQRKSGVLVVFDAQEESIVRLHIAQSAIDLLNIDSEQPYICIVSLVDEAKTSSSQFIDILGIKHPVVLNTEEALDELVLEVEYSYKLLGMSRHMSIRSKEQFKSSLQLESAKAMSADMNLFFLTE